MYPKLLGIALVVMFVAKAQVGRWADTGDATAKSLIDLERQWAEAACTHSSIRQSILADDFEGTSPEGALYSKAETVERVNSKILVRDCRLLDAKVRFYCDSVAIAFGSETATRKDREGRETTRKLIWTDTWLKRNGKWQIIAVQDMPSENK
jgi:hypothetical protein